MNSKTTVALLVLAAALGGWVYFDLNREPVQDTLFAPLLFEAPIGRVTRLEIDRPRVDPDPDGKKSAREHIIFEKRGGEWVLMEPLNVLADGKYVENMIREPSVRVPIRKMVPKKPLEEYGLGEDAVRVTMIYPGGRLEFRIGRTSEFERSQYVRLVGAEQIVLMDMDFAPAYLRPVGAYKKKEPRDRKKREVPAAPTT